MQAFSTPGLIFDTLMVFSSKPNLDAHGKDLFILVRFILYSLSRGKIYAVAHIPSTTYIHNAHIIVKKHAQFRGILSLQAVGPKA